MRTSTNTDRTIALCDQIVTRIEARREIDALIAEARREALSELRTGAVVTLRSVLKGGE